MLSTLKLNASPAGARVVSATALGATAGDVVVVDVVVDDGGGATKVTEKVASLTPAEFVML